MTELSAGWNVERHLKLLEDFWGKVPKRRRYTQEEAFKKACETVREKRPKKRRKKTAKLR